MCIRKVCPVNVKESHESHTFYEAKSVIPHAVNKIALIVVEIVICEIKGKSKTVAQLKKD